MKYIWRNARYRFVWTVKLALVRPPTYLERLVKLVECAAILRLFLPAQHHYVVAGRGGEGRWGVGRVRESFIVPRRGGRRDKKGGVMFFSVRCCRAGKMKFDDRASLSALWTRSRSRIAVASGEHHHWRRWVTSQQWGAYTARLPHGHSDLQSRRAARWAGHPIVLLNDPLDHILTCMQAIYRERVSECMSV